MGKFSGRSVEPEAAIDSFLGQKILSPKSFLKAAEGEEHYRAYGQSKYSTIRASLLKQGLESELRFWQGKVFLEPSTMVEEGSAPKQVYLIVFEGSVIGEISEFDRRAQEILDFKNRPGYVARAVIQDDLIGYLVHLYVNPENVL